RSKLQEQVNLNKNLEDFKYANLLEKGPLFIFTLDTQGVIIHSNSRAKEAIDLDEDFVVGEKFLNLVSHDHRKPFQNILNQMKEGDVRSYKCPVIGTKSNVYMMEFYITKMELQNDFPVTVVFAVDATQEYYKNVQLNRNQVLDEITRFSQIINGYLDNLLSVLLPHINMMKNTIKNEKWQRNFKVIQMSLNQTANMVQKFLNFDSRDVETPRTLNLNDIVREVIEEVKTKCPDSIKLNFSLDPAVPSLMLYPNRLKQLLTIFSQNSLEALPGKGRIRVSTKTINMEKSGILQPHKFYLKKGKYVELAFEDNGMGIDERILPQIFKPFFSTKIRNEGVGLGLYVAYNIVKDLEGEIFVESKPGVKTVFYVYIPAKEEFDMETILPGMAEAIVEKSPTILVVDDEFNIRSMLKEVFEMNGFSVYTAANGEEGVGIFREHTDEIDLIILDMVMPVMDGKRAFLEIQKIKKGQKIIIISGYAQRDDLQEILNKGALAFMSKPFQIDAIVEKVNECLVEIEK
ncbi:MAG: response regulator, partial [Calditrichia bacterium]